MTARRQSTLIDCLTLDSIVDQCFTCIPNMVLFTYSSAANGWTFLTAHPKRCRPSIVGHSNTCNQYVTRSLSRARTR